MMEYDFDIKLVSDSARWIVEIDSAANYGYFEDTVNSGEGGLWFEGNTLVDYDGFAELPKTVQYILEAAGYDLSGI